MQQGTHFTHPLQDGANLFPLGTNQEASASEQVANALAIGLHKQLYIDFDKWEKEANGDACAELAQAFNVQEKDLTCEMWDERRVIIIPFKDEESIKVALERNPKLKEYPLQNDVDMEIRNKDRKKMVKIRQCQLDTDIANLLAINDLGGWWGKLQPCKVGNKHTTAILTAPSEEEAQTLLEIGHLVDNGRTLAAVPADSPVTGENERTVLLVGINKLQAKHKEKGRKLTELSLLKTLTSAGLPIQAITLVELAGGRTGHSAFVLMKNAEDLKSLHPIKDTDSDTTLKWADLKNKNNICEKCLEWEEHEKSCPKHPDNKHKFATANETKKRAEEKGNIIQNRFKRQKESHQ